MSGTSYFAPGASLEHQPDVRRVAWCLALRSEHEALLGHKSVRTTEIYLKELIPETVRPNERPIIAGSK
jgi:hypothetical protein